MLSNFVWAQTARSVQKRQYSEHLLTPPLLSPVSVLVQSITFLSRLRIRIEVQVKRDPNSSLHALRSPAPSRALGNRPNVNTVPMHLAQPLDPGSWQQCLDSLAAYLQEDTAPPALPLITEQYEDHFAQTYHGQIRRSPQTAPPN